MFTGGDDSIITWPRWKRFKVPKCRIYGKNRVKIRDRGPIKKNLKIPNYIIEESCYASKRDSYKEVKNYTDGGHCMKITESLITMFGQHEFQQNHQITMGQFQKSPQPIKIPVSQINFGTGDELEISDDARNALEEARRKGEITFARFEVDELRPMEKLRLQVLDSSITAITDGSVRIRLRTPSRPLTLKVQIKRHEIYQESEKMSFAARGIIKTADGKEIDFSTELNMSREFVSATTTTVTQEWQLKDPLVINFDGPAAQLTDTKFSFDLDSDGVLDQISFLKPGSGFLALDQNQDGIVNNGSELFGTFSGNGFADLAKFDLDQNGWIDENDSVYENLRIWTKDEDGKDVLFALGQKGIGAIYLGNIDTQFSIKDAANQSQGEIRKTGIFLKEDGLVGTVQQIDLVV